MHEGPTCLEVCQFQNELSNCLFSLKSREFQSDLTNLDKYISPGLRDLTGDLPQKVNPFSECFIASFRTELELCEKSGPRYTLVPYSITAFSGARLREIDVKQNG
jgi:hypothetical protein